MSSERGESLAEVVITIAVVAIATAALFGATIVAAHRFGPQANKEAMRAALEREMRIAADVLKYRGASIAPNTIATSIPVPGASPQAVHMAIATTTLPDGSTQVTLSATLDSDPTQAASFSSMIAAPVPLPSATIITSGNAPQ